MRYNKKEMVYNQIAFLKGIAILGVILVHSPQLIPYIDKRIPYLLHFGAFGCQLFFMISGFLMMGSYERIISKNNNTLKSNFSFYKKRFLSIAPIYVIFVVFYQLISLFLEKEGIETFYPITHNTISILLNCCLMHGLDYNNLNHVIPGGWFIGTIFLFYIIFPLLYKLYTFFKEHYGNMIWLFPLFFVLLNFCIQCLIYYINGDWMHMKPSGYMYYSIFNQLPCMLLGMILYGEDDAAYAKNSYNFLYFMLLFVLGTLASIVFRTLYCFFMLLPSIIGLSFVFLFRYSRTMLNNNSLLIRIVERCGDLSFAAYFTNFICAFILPWAIGLLFKKYDIIVNGTLLYTILILPIFVSTFLLAVPCNELINKMKYK